MAGYSLIQTITQGTQSVEDNTSQITVKVEAKTASGYSWYNANDSYLTITVDGIAKKYTIDGFSIASGQTKTVATKTFTVNHNADGTKSVAVSSSYATGVSAVGTLKASGSKVLKTIPRASSIADFSATMGESGTITITPQVDIFYHRIKYTFGTANGTIGDIDTTTTTINWTPPTTLGSQTPNAITGTGLVIVETYSDSERTALVGSKSATLTLTVPSYDVAIGTITVTPVQPNEFPTDWNSLFVKGFSKASITATATTSYGATIASYTVQGSTVTNGSAYTTGILDTSGEYTITVYAKDSRGKTLTKTATVTVYDYATPNIVSMTAYRVASNGSTEETDDGKYVYINATVSVASVGGHNLYTVGASIDGNNVDQMKKVKDDIQKFYRKMTRVMEILSLSY